MHNADTIGENSATIIVTALSRYVASTSNVCKGSLSLVRGSFHLIVARHALNFSDLV